MFQKLGAKLLKNEDRYFAVAGKMQNLVSFTLRYIESGFRKFFEKPEILEGLAKERLYSKANYSSKYSDILTVPSKTKPHDLPLSSGNQSSKDGFENWISHALGNITTEKDKEQRIKLLDEAYECEIKINNAFRSIYCHL